MSKRARSPRRSPKKSPRGEKKVKVSPNYCTARRRYTEKTLPAAREWVKTIQKDGVAWIVEQSLAPKMIREREWHDQIISRPVFVLDSADCTALESPCSVVVFNLRCNQCTAGFRVPLEKRPYGGKTWTDVMISKDLLAQIIRAIFRHVLGSFLKKHKNWETLRNSGSNGKSFLYQSESDYPGFSMSLSDREKVFEQARELIRLKFPSDHFPADARAMFDMFLDPQNSARVQIFTYDPRLDCAVQVDCTNSSAIEKHLLENSTLDKTLLTRQQYTALRKQPASKWSRSLKQAFGQETPLVG